MSRRARAALAATLAGTATAILAVVLTPRGLAAFATGLALGIGAGALLHHDPPGDPDG